MATKKVLEVDETSIVDLKAELFRKEQQYRKKSGGGAKTHRPADGTKKPPVWSKQPKGTASQSRTQQAQGSDSPSEDDKTLQKSRQMLEAKAALYEKMIKGEIEDNDEETESGEGRFLVDFHKKIYKEGKRQQDKEEDNQDIGPPTPPPSCPEEEWVDYIDSLGRSRKCLRKDLKELQERDRKLLPRRSPSPPTLLSDDMRREIMRKKWEKEEEEARNSSVGPVHYQNIQFDEIRHHGVGYFQFSKVEEERQKQMETLKKLREETLDQRSRIEKIKDRRKAALEARLAKVRARKKTKTGEDAGDGQEDQNIEENQNENDEEIQNKEENELRKRMNKPDKTVDERVESEEAIKDNKKKQLPEWARHRIAQPELRTTYLKRRREERDEEFAPPSFYFETTSEESKHEAGKSPCRGSEGQKLPSQKYDGMSGTIGKRKVENTTQYPPPTGNLSSYFQPTPNYPPLPLPPQGNNRCPPAPAFFPPFPPPQYYGMMPPPTWLPPSPWQQFSSHQFNQSEELSHEDEKEVSKSKEQLILSEQTNSGLTKEDQEIRNSSSSATQAFTSSVVTPSEGNMTTTKADQVVADFVSSFRPKS